MLIVNGKFVTWEKENQLLEGQAILIDGDRVREIGPENALRDKYPQEEVVDAGGQLVMPGNICAHTHFYGAYARGLAIPGNAPKDFPEILEKLWWPLDKALDEKSVRASALVHLVDAIKHGTTTLFDHHASPNFIEGSLDVIGEAVERSGLRSVLCYEVTDRDGDEKARLGIQENMNFISKAANGGVAGGRVRATFGLHASLTLSDETLSLCREAQDGGGFHIHVAEHQADEYDSLNKSGMRVVDRLNAFDILGPRTIVAHGVHIDFEEARLLAETGTWLSHQPRSNMNNGVGVAPIESLMRLGINVCLGNDGFTQDMWTEWKTAYLLHKVWHQDPRRMNGLDVIQMGVYQNAALAEVFFPGQHLGTLVEGAAADLIFVDVHPFTPMHAGNLPWHILFGFNEGMVTSTMVAGTFLMRDRKLLTLDEEAIADEAIALAQDVWERYQIFAA